MSFTFFAALWAAGWPPLWVAFGRIVFRVAQWELLWAVIGAIGAILLLLSGLPWASVAAAVNCAIGLFLYWWNRRRRGRVRAWAGEKWRHLRDALVRRQREAVRPRPVLRPVPQGGVR